MNSMDWILHFMSFTNSHQSLLDASKIPENRPAAFLRGVSQAQTYSTAFVLRSCLAKSASSATRLSSVPPHTTRLPAV